MDFLTDIEFAPNRATVAQQNFETIEARVKGLTVPFNAVSSVTHPHNLGYKPTVVILVAGHAVSAEIEHIDLNTVTVRFTANYTGELRIR